jgi:hypothetical protein
MAITEQQLADLIEAAFDAESDTVVDPAGARRRQAEKIAAAVKQFVVGRETVITGTSVSGGPVTGTGIIQDN